MTPGTPRGRARAPSHDFPRKELGSRECWLERRQLDGVAEIGEAAHEPTGPGLPPWRQQAALDRSRREADALCDPVRDEAHLPAARAAGPEGGREPGRAGRRPGPRRDRLSRAGHVIVRGQRQHTGSAGNITDCQAGVLAAYVPGQGHASIDRRLCTPKSWTDPTACAPRTYPTSCTSPPSRRSPSRGPSGGDVTKPWHRTLVSSEACNRYARADREQVGTADRRHLLPMAPGLRPN